MHMCVSVFPGACPYTPGPSPPQAARAAAALGLRRAGLAPSLGGAGPRLDPRPVRTLHRAGSLGPALPPASYP